MIEDLPLRLSVTHIGTGTHSREPSKQEMRADIERLHQELDKQGVARAGRTLRLGKKAKRILHGKR